MLCTVRTFSVDNSFLLLSLLFVYLLLLKIGFKVGEEIWNVGSSSLRMISFRIELKGCDLFP